MMQLKTVGESLDALNEITGILNGNLIGIGTSETALSAIGKKYHLTALKQAIAQSTLNESQIQSILIGKGYRGQLLETTVAELAQAIATNTLAASEATVTGTTNGFCLALKGLGAQLKALIAAHPVIAFISAIGAVTFGAVKAVDYMSKSLERQKEKLATAKANYEETTSELANINSELEQVCTQIEELQTKGPFSFLDQEELNRLIAYRENLELAQEATKVEAKMEANKTAAESKKTYDKEFDDYRLTNTDEAVRAILAQNPSGYFQSFEFQHVQSGDISDQIAAYVTAEQEIERIKQEITQQKMEQNGIWDTSLNKELDFWKQLQEDSTHALNNSIQTLSAYQNDAKLAEEMDWDYYQELEDLQKLIHSYYNTGQWNTIKFENIFDREDIEITKEELVSLAKEGKLTANTLQSYPALYKAIQEADFIGNSGILLFLKQIRSAADAGKNSLGNFHLSEEQWNTFDAFQSQLAGIQDAFDNLSTNKPEENLKSLLALMKNDPNFDLTMYRFADGVIDYEGALNQLRQNAVEQTIRLIPELETEILSMGNAVETASQKATRLTKSYYEILNVLARVQRGESLTAAEIADLISKHSSLANAIQITADGFFIEAEALTNLAIQYGDTSKQAITAVLNQTQAAINGIYSRVAGYGIEAEALQTLAETYHSVTEGMDPVQKEHVLEQFKGAAEGNQGYEEVFNSGLFAELIRKQDHLASLQEQLNSLPLSPDEYDLGETKTTGSGKQFSGELDLVSISITTLTEKIALLKSELEHLTDPAKRMGKIKELSEAEQQLAGYYKTAANEYKEQYEVMKKGLPQEWIDALEKGTEFDIKQLSGSKDENDYNQFQKAQEAYRNWKEMEKNQKDSVQDWAKSLDWAAEEISNLNSELSMYESMLDNSESYKNSIKYCDILIQKHKELRDSTKDLLNVREKEYQDSLALLTDEQKKAVESNDLKKIEEFQGRTGEEEYNQVTDALEKKKKRDEAKSNLHKEHETWQNSYLEKADRVSQWYDLRTDNIDTRKNAIQKEVSIREASGLAVPAAYYEQIAELEKNKLDYLKKERQDLLQIRDAGVASGAIAKYSPEWYALTGQIQDTNLAILDCESSLVEMNNSIRDLDWGNFDKLMNKLDSINEEADFLIDLMSNADSIDENGNYTEEGLATLAMHRTKYQTKQEEAKRYKEEADSLADATDEASIERREELLSLQRDCIAAAEQEKQAMVALAQEGIQKQIDNMSELISKKKEALQAERDLQTYRESIAEKQKHVADLEKAMVALAGDDSEEAKKKKRQLQSDLADAKKDLADTERDHSYDEQEKALDQVLELYTTNMEHTLNDTEQLFLASMETVDQASQSVGNTLQRVAEQAGYEITTHITDIWKTSATEANHSADSFESVGERITNVMTGIVLKWGEVQAAAEQAGAAQLSAMGSDYMSSGTEDKSLKQTVETFLQNSDHYSSKRITSSNDPGYAKLSGLNKSLIDAGYGNLSYQGMADLANLLKINGLQTHTAVSIKQDSSLKKLIEEELKKLHIQGFSTGGLIRSVTKEDGYLLAQKGEAILSREAVVALQGFNSFAPAMSPYLFDVPSPQEVAPRDPGSQLIVSGGAVQIHIDQVENMDDFIYKMQDDRTQRLLQEAIWGNALGKGRMGIYQV
ncbi:MAG: hypothetical protein HFI40_01060 [Lachnospiraceae bacterium]|nr:hypothetical protein [Lachnospiraceae bacterium]